MGRRKLSPSEIVERLQAIDALTQHGQPLAEALRLVGVLPSDYLRWRLEYAGLLRTLAPLSDPPQGMIRRPRPGGRSRRTTRLLH
jgi:hypothetical protein